MKKNANFTKGTVIGAVVGLVAGILFAPKSGKETRDQIKSTAQRGVEDIQLRLDSLGDQVSEQIDKLKTAASELPADTKTEAKDLLARGETFRKDLKAALADLTETAKTGKGQAGEHAAKLLAEGQEIIGEAKRVSKQVAKSTGTKLSRGA